MFPPHDPTGRAFPWRSFLKASGLHVGAAAAAAALREDLAKDGAITNSEFDEAYAVARITPGTNLLALYTLLGERLTGWRGATAALALGAILPAVIAVAFAVVYTGYSARPLAAQAMQGARAGALAVLVWGGVRLLRPQLAQHRGRGVVLAALATIAALAAPVSPIVVLLAGGVLGLLLLRATP